MARAIWSGAISFGLVNVPVKVFSAISQRDVRFHQLHDRDGVRIRQKRVCPADGEEVPYENIVKGYEIAPDRYVVVTPDELESLEPRRSRMIEVTDFVDLAEIDPVYFERSYYLVPAPGAGKAYALLLEALRESGKVAVGRFVMRNKEYLAAIRPLAELLGMSTMLFADEVVPASAVAEEIPEAAEPAAPSERELAMARQLVESLSAPFEPGRYRDTYRDRLMELIERKAAGEQIAVQPAEEPKPVPDLMTALEQSLAAVRAGRSGPGDGASGKRARKAPAKTKTAAKAKPAAKAEPAPGAKRKARA